MDCNVTYLGDLSIDGGKYGIAAPAVEYDPQFPAYLRISDINDDGTLNTTDRKSVADPSAKNYMLKRGDIVFARTGGSTGRNYYYDERDGNFAFAGFLIKFSLDPTRVNPRFIKYYTQSKPYWNWIRSFNTGSTRGNINAKTLANMPIPLPSQPVQNAIVSICDSISEKIRLNNRLNGYLEELGQSLLSECLRSCGDMLPLSSVMSLGSGFAFKSSTYTNDGKFKILTIKNVQDGSVDCSNSNRIDDPPKKMRGFCNLQLGSVVLSLTGNVGRVGIVSEEDCLLNQRVAVIQPHQSSLLPGLYFYFRQKSFQNEMIGIARGTAQANLSPLETLQLEIPYDKQAFDEVNSSLLPVFDLILANKVESTKLANLRDTLLPKLMSGEIDVSKVDLKQLNSHLADC